MIPDYENFARDWEAAWNARDLEHIFTHYSDDVVFSSRKAFEHLGVGELHGKVALRRYWRAALEAQPDLRFEVQSVFGGHNMLVINYRNQKGVLAAEVLRFRHDGLVEQAAACHGNWMEEQSYRVQVDLWIKSGKRAAFDAYERKALAAMSVYGGKLVEVTRSPLGADECHILSFPTKEAFEAYLGGPDSKAARPVREDCIAETKVTELEP